MKNKVDAENYLFPDTVEVEIGDCSKAAINVHMDVKPSINTLTFLYVTDIHLDNKFTKKFRNEYSENEAETYIEEITEKIWKKLH